MTGRPPVPDWRRHKPCPFSPRPPSSTLGHGSNCLDDMLNPLRRYIMLFLTIPARSEPLKGRAQAQLTRPLGITRAGVQLYVKICTPSLRPGRASSSVPRRHASSSIEPDSEGFQPNSLGTNSCSLGGAGEGAAPRADHVLCATRAYARCNVRLCRACRDAPSQGELKLRRTRGHRLLARACPLLVYK